MKKGLSVAIAGAAALGLIAAPLASATGESGVRNTGQCVKNFAVVDRAAFYSPPILTGVWGPAVQLANGVAHGPVVQGNAPFNIAFVCG